MALAIATSFCGQDSCVAVVRAVFSSAQDWRGVTRVVYSLEVLNDNETSRIRLVARAVAAVAAAMLAAAVAAVLLICLLAAPAAPAAPAGPAAPAAPASPRKQEACYHAELRVPGVCRPLAACKRVHDLALEQDVPPQACRSQDYSNGVLVCCPEPELPAAPCRPSEPRQPVCEMVDAEEEAVNPNLQGLRVADRKCLEYRQLVWQPSAVGSLQLGALPDCEEACSRSDPAALIVGGEDAQPKEFPHMALLINQDGVATCGGSLISENFVLTAAHCYDPINRSPRHVLLGEYNRNATNVPDQELEQLIAVKRHIRHPDHSRNWKDIMLLELASPANMSAFVRPACLLTDPHLLDSPQDILASGWGRIIWVPTNLENALGGTSSASILQRARFELFPQEQCKRVWSDGRRVGTPRNIQDWQICAQGVQKNEKRADTCQGDSGGPLQINAGVGSNCTSTIVGITSFGFECASGVPGVYTRVTPFLKWIEETVWPCG